MEREAPILTEEARRLSFTNEGGVGGTIRFLKNVGGLWLLQECQRHWQREGQPFTWPELVALAEAVPPLRSLVDPDAPEFLNPTICPLPSEVTADVRASPSLKALERWCAAAWRAWHWNIAGS